MKTILSILGFVIVAIIAARFIPVDNEQFHEDPAEPDARISEVRLIGREAPRYPADAETVLETFADIATSDWTVGLVEGSIDEGMMTFVARSLVFGFRDYITVKATDEAGGAKLSVFARPRINGYDWGMNAKRLDRWLGELEQTLGR
mgnify:CR=1 FL=1